MSTVLRPHKATVVQTGEGYLRLRRGAVAVSAIVTLLYAILFFVVRGIETAPPGTETTYGAYLFLTIAYLVSTVAYAVLDRRAVWLAGAILQVVVIGLFVVFGLAVLEYELLVEATPIGLWAGVITALQVVLLGVLGYLATLKPAGRHAA